MAGKKAYVAVDEFGWAWYVERGDAAYASVQSLVKHGWKDQFFLPRATIRTGSTPTEADGDAVLGLVRRLDKLCNILGDDTDDDITRELANAIVRWNQLLHLRKVG